MSSATVYVSLVLLFHRSSVEAKCEKPGHYFLGDEVKITCGINGTYSLPEWTKKDVALTTEGHHLINYDYAARFSYDTDNKTLIITNVEKSDEGIYSCASAGKDDSPQTFEVIVEEPINDGDIKNAVLVFSVLLIVVLSVVLIRQDYILVTQIKKYMKRNRIKSKMDEQKEIKVMKILQCCSHSVATIMFGRIAEFFLIIASGIMKSEHCKTHTAIVICIVLPLVPLCGKTYILFKNDRQRVCKNVATIVILIVMLFVPAFALIIALVKTELWTHTVFVICIVLELLLLCGKSYIPCKKENQKICKYYVAAIVILFVGALALIIASMSSERWTPIAFVICIVLVLVLFCGKSYILWKKKNQKFCTYDTEWNLILIACLFFITVLVLFTKIWATEEDCKKLTKKDHSLYLYLLVVEIIAFVLDVIFLIYLYFGGKPATSDHLTTSSDDNGDDPSPGGEQLGEVKSDGVKPDTFVQTTTSSEDRGDDPSPGEQQQLENRSHGDWKKETNVRRRTPYSDVSGRKQTLLKQELQQTYETRLRATSD